MNGDRIVHAKAAVEGVLGSLPSHVLFNIISFGSTFRSLFPSSVLASEQNIAEG
jgi:hypothetical protein